MKPIVSIELDEYNRLKDLEYQMNFLIKKVVIKKELIDSPLKHCCESIKFGYIKSKDLDFFYKNLLDIERLIQENDDN